MVSHRVPSAVWAGSGPSTRRPGQTASTTPIAKWRIRPNGCYCTDRPNGFANSGRSQGRKRPRPGLPAGLPSRQTASPREKVAIGQPFTVMGVTLTVSIIYVFVNLLVDIAYVLLDPRISYGSASGPGR